MSHCFVRVKRQTNTRKRILQVNRGLTKEGPVEQQQQQNGEM